MAHPYFFVGDSSVREPASDMLREASRRLAFVGLLVAGAATLNLAIDVLLEEASDPDRVGLTLLIAGIRICASLLVAAYARGRTLTRTRIVYVGFAYLLLITFFTGVEMHAIGLPAGPWSRVAVGILLFPVLIPCSPAAAAVAGVSATLTDIAALLAARGVAAAFELGWIAWVGTFRGDLVATAVAYALAVLMYGLRTKVVVARRMGAYQLKRRIGTGGMGEVWLAEHARLARPVAVKLIRAEQLAGVGEDARREAIARFTREARSAASLRSHHTIAVLDFGVTDEGTLYYVMEYLEGQDLHDAVCNEGPMPPSRVIHLMMQACESLHEAHLEGLVHRDVKPANLFLCAHPGAHDWLKVLDFGLVKATDREDALHSIVGLVVGTPAFMAPEQARGEAIDGRADLYALGCVMYWLLMGRFVFDTATSAQMLIAQATQTPQALDPGIPEPLASLVMQCLAKSADARPPSAAALLAELQTLAVRFPWTPADTAALPPSSARLSAVEFESTARWPS